MCLCKLNEKKVRAPNLNWVVDQSPCLALNQYKHLPMKVEYISVHVELIDKLISPVIMESTWIYTHKHR